MLTPLLSAITPLPPSSPLSLFITPGDFSSLASNGTYTTPFFTANASGGQAPYSYEWSVTGAFSLYNTVDEKTKTRTSGYNQINGGKLFCVVTDSNLDTHTESVFLEVEFWEF